MEGILLIDKEKKMQWNKLSSDLNNKLYFIQKHQNDTDEKTVEYLKTHCTIENLVEISKKMNEIEKIWYRGEIVVQNIFPTDCKSDEQVIFAQKFAAFYLFATLEANNVAYNALNLSHENMKNTCNYSDNWQTYINDYDKFEYDVKTKNGGIFENVYPNNGWFSTDYGVKVHESIIAEIRFSQKPKMGINDFVSKAKFT